jgi:hypothetical protein
MGCEDLLWLDRHGFTTPTLHADLRLPQTLLWVLHWLGLVTLWATSLGILVQFLVQSNVLLRLTQAMFARGELKNLKWRCTHV